jgi:hypothetical protein
VCVNCGAADYNTDLIAGSTTIGEGSYGGPFLTKGFTFSNGSMYCVGSNSGMLCTGNNGTLAFYVDTNGVPAFSDLAYNNIGTSVTQVSQVIELTGTVQTAWATLTPSQACTESGSTNMACVAYIKGVGATTNTSGNFAAAYTFSSTAVATCL